MSSDGRLVRRYPGCEADPLVINVAASSPPTAKPWRASFFVRTSCSLPDAEQRGGAI